MSLIITTYAPEGIILAGDSRLTLNWNKEINGHQTQFSITASDSNRKVFAIKNKFGLGTVSYIPQSLHEFFGDGLGKPETSFYLCGYKLENNISVPHIYYVDIAHSQTNRINLDGTNIQYGANWGGETEVMMRLLNNIKINNGTDWVELTTSGIPFNFFTLQDAIDFSIYAVRTTIETFRFQQRIKTVGGPIDILAITTDGTNWIQNKELTAINMP